MFDLLCFSIITCGRIVVKWTNIASLSWSLTWHTWMLSLCLMLTYRKQLDTQWIFLFEYSCSHPSFYKGLVIAWKEDSLHPEGMRNFTTCLGPKFFKWQCCALLSLKCSKFTHLKILVFLSLISLWCKKNLFCVLTSKLAPSSPLLLKIPKFNPKLHPGWVKIWTIIIGSSKESNLLKTTAHG